MHFLTRDLFLKSLRDVSFSVSLHFFRFISFFLFLVFFFFLCKIFSFDNLVMPRNDMDSQLSVSGPLHFHGVDPNCGKGRK